MSNAHMLNKGIELANSAASADANGDLHTARKQYVLAVEAFMSVLRMQENPVCCV